MNRIPRVRLRPGPKRASWRHGAAWAGLLALATTSALAEEPAPLVALDDVAPRVELAPYMGELQMLTHKLSLSVGSGHFDLIRFYAYESIESLKGIQSEVPEYDGQPIALLVERLGLPPYQTLLAAVESEAALERARADGSLDAAMSGVVGGCNDCHAATSHGFIRITDERKRNPFNQSFD